MKAKKAEMLVTDLDMVFHRRNGLMKNIASVSNAIYNIILSFTITASKISAEEESSYIQVLTVLLSDE